MNKTTAISLALLFSLSFSFVGRADNQPEPLLSLSQNEFLRQGKFSMLEKALQEAVKKAVAGKSVDQILADEKLMHLVTAAELIRITGAGHMDALFAKNPKYARFLATFLQDNEWMQLYLRAGLVPTDTDVGLRVLGDIWNADGQSEDFRQYLSLATGIASTWGAGRNHKGVQLAELNPAKGIKCDPVWRFNFFKKAHKENELHPNFMKLQPWEIRFTAGYGVDDASFQYVQDNIRIPWDQYSGACWYAGYKGMSDLGESIHGSMFYIPCGNETGLAQQTYEWGGVCGKLSTMATVACAARGIPAYAVGQPGHCAYAFRLERGDWQGGFGGPYGGMKEYIFFDGNDPTSRDLMEAVFADDDNVAQSYREASLARVLTALGQDDLARKAWEKTMKTAPLNAFFRQDFQQFALDRNLFSPDEWLDYGRVLLQDFKGHGLAAVEVFKDVQDRVLQGQDDKVKLAWFADVHKALAATPMVWSASIDGAMNDEAKLLSNPSSYGELLTLALKEHLHTGNGQNFGTALNWGVKNILEQGKEDVFTKAFESVATGGSGSAQEKDVKALGGAYSKAIQGAERARSRTAFNILSKFAVEFQGNERGPLGDEFDCPPGILASEGGFLIPSSYGRGDRAYDHVNVLKKSPGLFRTDEEENPHVIIELPESIQMSGLLLVKARHFQEQIKNIKVSRSTDGATWFEVAATNDMPYQWKIQTRDAPETRWIKVESTKPEKNYLMLRNILVFKKNA